jgi:uncharacterized protein (TIGR03118 family)
METHVRTVLHPPLLRLWTKRILKKERHQGENMSAQNRACRGLTFLGSLVIGLGLIRSPLAAQYNVTNLVSSQAGKAKHQDPDLINAWGIAYAPSAPFCVTDTGIGLATLYDAQGVKQSLVITVPAASNRHGTPTGIVYNGTTAFQVSQGGHSGPAMFIFDTIDGTISGWNSSVNSNTAIIVVNNSSSGASYTGLAIGTHNGVNFIYAADHKNNKVDIYNRSFKLVKSFTDPNLPSGSAPFNVQTINGQLFVAFTNPKVGGAVDIFSMTGKLIKTFTSGSELKGPWGMARAPVNFGPASKTLLVGNLNDGRINAFNATTGQLIGPLKNPQGKIISESGLWAIAFGGGTSQNGKTNQLFFAAGPNNEKAGLFGAISYKK